MLILNYIGNSKTLFYVFGINNWNRFLSKCISRPPWSRVDPFLSILLTAPYLLLEFSHRGNKIILIIRRVPLILTQNHPELLNGFFWLLYRHPMWCECGVVSFPMSFNTCPEDFPSARLDWCLQLSKLE